MEVNDVASVFKEILTARLRKAKKLVLLSIPAGAVFAPLISLGQLQSTQNEYGRLIAMNLPMYTIGAPVVLVALIFAFTVFWFPSDVAKKRKHTYLQIIQILNIISPLTALSAWVVAVIWAVYPSSKSLADPLVVNTTGLGSQNDNL